MRNKRFIVGFVTATFLFSTTFTFAESFKRNIEVEFTSDKVYVDNKELNLSNKAFYYESTLYAPVNTVLQSVGKIVQTSKQTNNIYFENRIEIVEESGKKYVTWRSVLPLLMETKYRASRRANSIRLYYESNGKQNFVTDYFVAEAKAKSLSDWVVIDYEVFKKSIEPLLNEKR